jgi:hypothetical protein
VSDARPAIERALNGDKANGGRKGELLYFALYVEFRHHLTNPFYPNTYLGYSLVYETVECPIDLSKEVPAAAATKFRFKLHSTEKGFLERNETTIEFEAPYTTAKGIKYDERKTELKGNDVEILIKYKFYVEYGPDTRRPHAGFNTILGYVLEQHDWQKFGVFSAQT